MITTSFRHPWGWTAAAPVACAFHCAATPLAAVAAPSLASNGRIEWALLLLTLVFAAFALVFGFRTHGSRRPILPVSVGIGIWILSLAFFGSSPAVEFSTMAGSVLVATGLFWNSRMSCVTGEGDCPGCQDILHDADRRETTGLAVERSA